MIDLNNNSPDLHLPGNLRALRKRMKWSQEELAEKLGLNRGNIASYESGTAEPKICNLVKVARLFKISIFDLTHNNLKEEAQFVRAMRRDNNNGPIIPALDQYAAESKEFESAVKGLECIFKMKLREAGDLPENIEFFKNQFEQLHNVARHILRSHEELINIVKSKCPSQNMNGDGNCNEFNA